MAESLSAGLIRLGLLRRREAILKRRAKKAAEARAQHEAAMFDQMVADGFKPKDSSIRLSGIHYIPDSTDFAVVQDKAKLIPWLMAHDSGIIEKKLMQGELNRLVREKLDNGEELPPGLGYYTKTRVTTKGATKQEVHDDEGE